MINKNEAYKALEKLKKSGFVTAGEASGLWAGVEGNISFKKWAERCLGEDVAAMYLKEEEAEHQVLHSIKLSVADLSLPEWYVLSLDVGLSPWHTEDFASTSKIAQEAAEPWHWSLKLRGEEADKRVEGHFGEEGWPLKTQQILSYVYRG